MIRNYLLIAIRTLRRNRLFSIVNIFGLALSMAVGMMVILRTRDNLSYDRFHPSGDRLYRVINKVTGDHHNSIYAASTPAPVLSLLGNPAAVSIAPVEKQDVSYGTKAICMNGVFTQSTFFKLFGFPLAHGAGVVDQPGNIVLSADAAANLFGSEDPIGKVVTLDRFGVYIVNGVLQPRPEKSHLKFDYYLSSSAIPALQKAGKLVPDVTSWNTWQKVYTYVKVSSRADGDKMIGTLNAYASGAPHEDTYRFELQRLSDITPSSVETYNDIAGGSGWGKIYTECGIALLILLAGCFNYTNLTIARGLTRGKEVGIRKVAGARRYQVFIQYIAESIVVALIAVVPAYVILAGILKYKPFNDGYEFMPDVRMGLDVYLIFFVFSLFAGLLAGSLPAWILSAFKPVEVLKNIRTKKLFGNISLQRSLIVFQFSLSLVVLIFLSAFYSQFAHLATVDPGFRTRNILSVSLDGADPGLISAELRHVRGTEEVTALSGNFGLGWSGATGVRQTKGKDPIRMNNYFADAATVPVMALSLAAGGNFPDAKPSAEEKYVLINEKAARVLSFKANADAVDQYVFIDDSTRVQIKGVVKDFYFHGTGVSITPMVLRMKAGSYAWLNIRVDHANESVVNEIGAVWKKLYPHKVFSWLWLKKEIDSRHDQTATLSLLGFLAFVTITIGSLGLLGLVIYTIEVRKKEISIRKVIGARVDQLLSLVSKGFIKLLLISGCIALPIGYVLSFLFLMNFANRSSFGVFHLLVCFGFLLVIGLVTILSQTWKAATENPAPNLRLE